MTRRIAFPVAALAALLVAIPVLATHVAPRYTTEAESCGPLAPGTVELLVAAGSLGDAVAQGDFNVDVEISGTVEDGSIAFENATLPVRAAFVAGAVGGNFYEYPEPVTADDGLVAPNGGPITNVSFCYVTDETAPSGSAQANGAGPAGSPDTAGGGTPPATDTDSDSDGVSTGRAPVLVILLVVAGVGLASTGLALARVPVTSRRAAPRPDRGGRRRRP